MKQLSEAYVISVTAHTCGLTPLVHQSELRIDSAQRYGFWAPRFCFSFFMLLSIMLTIDLA
jgi:hypothetical protein